ncbi:GH3 auxin-responsive promoter family protein [Clostridium frigoris]|uniref:GH3 auxin-responsive promoter family protein n=1 Tax=Clostridium frigoris TaxID=205327 RepID=A0ABS6BVX0_9CLOT|nr:GH3 auxin-responsive promoter family protein [Clostridium frigoris]MBU3161072.1 GH3 auxin-responsive promoter family protein [Clostridium frigoris]
MNILEWVINQFYAIGSDFFYKKFVKDTIKAGDINRGVLQEILQGNSKTVYGLLYEFEGIRTSVDYKRIVPLTSYPDYENYIEEIAAGLENVLTSDEVNYFGLSSGTTGKQKRIPTTAKTRKIINMSMMFLQHGSLSSALPAARTGGKGLLLMNMLQSGNTPVGIPSGSGTSGGMQSMKKMLHYFWTSPLEVLAIKDQQVANYLHLLFALKERNLAYITSPFPSSIVQLFGVLEKQWVEIIEDITKGTISSRLTLDVEVREQLEKQLKPEPIRAKDLERELSKGMKAIAQRVWPKISNISCVAGGSFGIYMDRLRYYIGDLPVFSAVYGATEALIGMATNVNDVSYVVTPRSAYFEFIPLKKSDNMNPKTFDLDELNVGEMYEVVITNYSGFYRYRMGDVVKVVDYSHQSPVIEFMYRKGQLLNLAAEKTSEQAVRYALGETTKASGVILEDYTVTLKIEDVVGHYLFYIEINELVISATKALEMKSTLEQCLGDANPRYRAGVNAKRINEVDIHFVQTGTFQILKQELLKRGASLNQVKIPRMIQDPSLIMLLEKNIIT